MSRITFKEINAQLATEGVDVELVRKGKDKQLTWVQKSTGAVLKQYQRTTLDDKETPMTVERWMERGRLCSDRCLGTNFRHEEYDDLPSMTNKVQDERIACRQGIQQAGEAMVITDNALQMIPSQKDILEDQYVRSQGYGKYRPLPTLSEQFCLSLKKKFPRICEILHKFEDGTIWVRSKSRRGNPLNHLIKVMGFLICLTLFSTGNILAEEIQIPEGKVAQFSFFDGPNYDFITVDWLLSSEGITAYKQGGGRPYETKFVGKPISIEEREGKTIINLGPIGKTSDRYIWGTLECEMNMEDIATQTFVDIVKNGEYPLFIIKGMLYAWNRQVYNSNGLPHVYIQMDQVVITHAMGGMSLVDKE